MLELILGQHNVRIIGMPELSSSFNGWVEGVQVVRVEEMMALGRRELMNKLKPLITESTVMVNQKGIQTYTIPNHVNLLLFSNHSDALRLDPDDRRYGVIHCPVSRRPKSYYRELFDWTNENGPALLHYFLERDVSEFDSKAPPLMTESKGEMIEASRDPLQALMMMRVEAREHPFEHDLVVVAHLVEAMSLDRAFSGLKVNVNTVSLALRQMAPGCRRQVRLSNGTRPRIRAVRNQEAWGARSEVEWAKGYRRP